MHWVFLSPHLDDVAISCAGLAWELSQGGHTVSVWSICAGKMPPGPLSEFAESLHARWETGAQAVRVRRAEDRRSCRRMGARPLHLDLPDCIYRRAGKPPTHLYTTLQALFGPLHPAEQPLIRRLARRLLPRLPVEACLVAPLALGNHVDHQLTRQAAEQTGHPLYYYADYPYAAQESGELDALSQAGWQPQAWPVSPPGLQAWVAAVWEHQSQISTFWSGREDLQASVAAYSEQMGGVRLWSPLAPGA